MKLRNILAALVTVVALTACDNAEKVDQSAIDKASETTSEVAEAAKNKAAEMAKAAEEKAAELKAATEAKAAEAAKMAEEAKAAAAAKAFELAQAAEEKAAEMKAAAEAKAAEVANMAEEAKTAAAAKASELAKAAEEKAAEMKAAAEAKAAEATKMAEDAKAAAEKEAAADAAKKAEDAETTRLAEAAKIAAVAAGMTNTVESTATTAAKAVTANDTKVGFVYVGPIGDHGWSYQHNQSRLALEKELGVTTSYVESVPEGADAERVIRQLAADGNDVIFTTSFGYMNPTNKVAKMFPEVKFEHATGYKRAKNVSTYSARFYEGRAILGAIAGQMTKTNTIGYIASFPIPEVIRGINAMTLAARKVNPDVKVKVVWVNTWFDPGKEGDAAKALIDQGADIITQHTDSPAPLQVAEKRGVYGFGQASNMKAFAPKAQLTAIVNNWDKYYIKQVKSTQDGSWTSTDTWDGIKAGMVTMAPYGDAVPQDVRDYANSIKAAIVDGTFHPFQGPIKNQAGELIVKEGEVIPDGELAKMGFYVEGVDGTIPK